MPTQLSGTPIVSPIFAFLLVTSLLTLSACDSQTSTKTLKTESPQKVIAQAVEFETQTTTIEVVGTSRALQSVILHPKLAGEITAVLFKTGDHVKKDTPLIKLDDKDIKYAVELAKVELADAKRRLARYQKTRESGTVTPSELDEASSAVELAQIRLERAKNNLLNHTIKAPFDGHVGLMELDTGAWVDSSTHLVSIDDRSKLLVSFEVPELFFDQLKISQPVELALWSTQHENYIGTIVDIASRIDVEKRTFTVRALIDNKQDILRPGMSFRVTLSLSSGSYAKVQETALQWGGDGAYIWIIKDGQAKKQPVNIVKRLAGFILVDAQLEPGTMVISEGTQRIRGGQKIDPSSLTPSQDTGSSQ